MTNTATTCDTCSAPKPANDTLLSVTDGRTLCVSCWNNEVDAARAARKIQLAEARAARKPAPVRYVEAGGWAAIEGLNRMMGAR